MTSFHQSKHGRMRLVLLTAFFLSACVVHYVDVPSTFPASEHERNQDIRLFVTVRQLYDPVLSTDRRKWPTNEDRDYGRLVLEGLQKAIGSQKGVVIDETSPLSITLQTTMAPDEQWNRAGCFTLLVIPVWRSYTYPVDVIVRYRGREIRRKTYYYSTTKVVGWISLPGNLLLSSWHPRFYAGEDFRSKGLHDNFASFFENVAADAVHAAREQMQASGSNDGP